MSSSHEKPNEQPDGIEGSAAAPLAPPSAPRLLVGRQQALFIALGEKNKRIAEMYMGAVTVLEQDHNPDRMALAAHGLRELMEKLPRYLDVPLSAQGPGLRARVQALRTHWRKLSRKRAKAVENDDDVAAFHVKLEEFFAWEESEIPSRLEQVSKVIRELDPTREALPGPIEDLRIKEWDSCHGVFQGVSHHTLEIGLDDFRGWLRVLETFLLDRLKPRTFEDQAELDKLIREAESNAQA